MGPRLDDSKRWQAITGIDNGLHRSDRPDEAELLERRDAVLVEPLIPSAILLFSIRSTVVPVECIFCPVAGGSDPMRKSLKAGAGAGAAVLPVALDVIALGDRSCGTPEVEIRGNAL